MRSPDVKSQTASLGGARRFADPNAPLDARLMAASGALPLPPPQLVTVLYALTLDPDAAVKDKALASLQALPDRVLDPALDAKLHPDVLGLCAELFARFADPRTFTLFPGARALLSALRARGLVVGVVSNWSERLPGILDGLGIGELLDFSVVSAIERVEKPERAIFELALRRAGVAAERALHCGDDPERDVQGAGALGILTVRVEHGGRGDAATVGDLFELERWIRERIERA